MQDIFLHCLYLNLEEAGYLEKNGKDQESTQSSTIPDPGYKM